MRTKVKDKNIKIKVGGGGWGWREYSEYIQKGYETTDNYWAGVCKSIFNF